jgi:hypothetical protein
LLSTAGCEVPQWNFVWHRAGCEVSELTSFLGIADWFQNGLQLVWHKQKWVEWFNSKHYTIIEIILAPDAV